MKKYIYLKCVVEGCDFIKSYKGATAVHAEYNEGHDTFKLVPKTVGSNGDKVHPHQS